MACFSNPAGALDSWGIIPAKGTRVWIGSFTVENLTPTVGWPPNLYLAYGLSMPNQQFSYGHGTQCKQGNGDEGWTAPPGNAFRVPFVFVEHNAYTPNAPNGSPSMSFVYRVDEMNSAGKSELTLPLSV